MNSEEKNKQENKINNKIYLSFNVRLFIDLALFFIMSLSGVYICINSFVINEQKVINYSENSNLDYLVYLKDNEFYDQEYLEKDMYYVASLIDKINIDFNYNFNIEQLLDLNFEYDILAKIIITDESNKKTYFEKDIKLLDKKSVALTGNSKKIYENIEINYDEYNRLANNFKNSYGLDTTSKLVIYFNVTKNIGNDKNNNLFVDDSVNTMMISIPLSEKAIDISLDYKDIKNQSRIIDNNNVVINNVVLLIFGILLIICSLVFLIKMIKLLSSFFNKKNVYDNYVNKILNEYDRFIAETTSSPFVEENDEKRIVKIEKFTELLDIRDNLKVPIMYYNVVKHHKCYFFIENDGKIYLTTIKKVDLEEKNEK